jgi:pyridoxamine 5'-phosphate oxidase
MSDLASLRMEYRKHSLDVTDVHADPFVQFHQWFREAREAEIVEPNAMTLATADADGQPSSRTLLLKGLDERGFTFFTNYASRKGRELDANPRASITILWRELERQVNIGGSIERCSRSESADYFAQRPYGSRIGAHASLQSTAVTSRAWLEERYAELTLQWPEGSEVPLPDSWGGYRLIPHSIEFWQGRPSRMHDRIRYRRENTEGAWLVERLSP